MGMSYSGQEEGFVNLVDQRKNPHIYLKVKFNLYKARYTLAPWLPFGFTHNTGSPYNSLFNDHSVLQRQ